jgi:flagellar motor switch protein FliN/FliY
MIVASGLSTRFQIFTFPPNLQRSEEVVRIQASIVGEGLNGQMLWLMDPETAHLIAGLTVEEEPSAASSSPFASFGGGIPALGQGHGMGEDPGSLEILMDVPLDISVELGRTKMTVRDVLELSTGSVVEIERLAGEPVDVLINGRIVAKGEVVVIEDNFGVRLTEILNPLERNRANEAA